MQRMTSLGGRTITLYVTEFCKITHMVAPKTIRIFEFSMVLLIAETTFKNISKLFLGIMIYRNHIWVEIQC